MDLGQRLRQARLDAGLSQRQLCEGLITRNMLSLIENGSAKPSMDTLRALAGRLGKPIGFFLEEQAVTSPNLEIMARAREAFAAGDPGAAVEALADYRGPDRVFDGEKDLLLTLGYMTLAEQALMQGRRPYAAALLAQAEQAAQSCPYDTPGLQRQRILLLARTNQENAAALAEKLPSEDEALLLQARAALEAGDGVRCGQLLDAAQDREAPLWHLYRGEAFFAAQDYENAAPHYHRAEESYPDPAVARLEVCYRELGDYKTAYEYACKSR